MIFFFPVLDWSIFELVIGIRLLRGKKLKNPPIYIGIVDIVIGVFLLINMFTFLFGLGVIAIGVINIVNMKKAEMGDYFGKEDIEDEYAEYLKDD